MGGSRNPRNCVKARAALEAYSIHFRWMEISVPSAKAPKNLVLENELNNL